MKITEDIRYIGVNDHDIDLFEGQFEVPLGMAYNSYVILDEKIAVMDTVESRFTETWLENLREALGGRTPDYLIIQHMEPDHSAGIAALLEAYPDTVLVGNKKTFAMLDQFYTVAGSRLTVGGGQTLPLGAHTLRFILAPMVHWPEVMVTYEEKDRVLFTADAFGKFGANDVEDPEGWDCEARRYYFGIVGKYGGQVQRLLEQLKGLTVAAICPLHGPVLRAPLDHYLEHYDLWSSYTPEDEGVLIAYTSVYGHTKAAAEYLAEQLKARGCPIVSLRDLAREDVYEAVEEAFRYSGLVLATTTYNGGVFPAMGQFIDHLTERGYRNRAVGLVENGTWAPMAAKGMRQMLEGSKDLRFTDTTVTLRSAMTEADKAALDALAAELWTGHAPETEEVPETQGELKRWVCTICGYIYEGTELPEDFTCPLCHMDASFFEPAE